MRPRSEHAGLRSKGKLPRISLVLLLTLCVKVFETSSNKLCKRGKVSREGRMLCRDETLHLSPRPKVSHPGSLIK